MSTVGVVARIRIGILLECLSFKCAHHSQLDAFQVTTLMNWLFSTIPRASARLLLPVKRLTTRMLFVSKYSNDVRMCARFIRTNKNRPENNRFVKTNRRCGPCLRTSDTCDAKQNLVIFGVSVTTCRSRTVHASFRGKKLKTVGRINTEYTGIDGRIKTKYIWSTITCGPSTISRVQQNRPIRRWAAKHEPNESREKKQPKGYQSHKYFCCWPGLAPIFPKPRSKNKFLQFNHRNPFQFKCWPSTGCRTAESVPVNRYCLPLFYLIWKRKSAWLLFNGIWNRVDWHERIHIEI